MAILIPIDHGNDSIKTENFRFRSGITAHKVQPPSTDELLEINGMYYTLSRERIPYMKNKTKDERFFYLTLIAIAKELMATDNYAPLIEVDLAVGLPPEHFGPLKDTFAAYFRRGNVQFIFNGKPFCVVIRHVVVCPQAYSAILGMDKDIAEMPSVFIIDGGGVTYDIGLLQMGRPDYKFNRSLEEGTVIMYNEVCRLVNAQHDMTINEDQILAVLQDAPVRLPEDVLHTIKVAAYDHANNVLNKLRELKVELRSNPGIFMGGAAELFKPVIEKSELVLDARFNLDPKCNVIGYKLFAQNRIDQLEKHAQ